MAIDATLDTFPKLLIRNARVRADRAAIRHKDLGIWQTWTWAEVLRRCAPMRSASTGSGSSAARRSPSSAPTGRDSTGRSWPPRCSAPSRSRSMPTRSPTSWPMCSPTPKCGSRRWRTRSRSTRSCRFPSGCRSSSRWFTTSRAACATMTTAACIRSTRSSARAARRSRTPRSAPGSIRRSRPARAPTSRSSSIPRAPPAHRRA